MAHLYADDEFAPVPRCACGRMVRCPGDTCDPCQHLTRACHDAMRELAAVAGLALWADRVLWPGSESPQDVTDCEPWDCERLRPLLGWEAPDA